MEFISRAEKKRFQLATEWQTNIGQFVHIWDALGVLTLTHACQRWPNGMADVEGSGLGRQNSISFWLFGRLTFGKRRLFAFSAGFCLQEHAAEHENKLKMHHDEHCSNNNGNNGQTGQIGDSSGCWTLVAFVCLCAALLSNLLSYSHAPASWPLWQQPVTRASQSPMATGCLDPVPNRHLPPDSSIILMFRIWPTSQQKYSVPLRRECISFNFCHQTAFDHLP